MRRVLVSLVTLALGGDIAWSQDKALMLGMSPSLMKDLSEGQRKYIKSEFPGLVKEFTGLTGTLTEAKSLDALATSVADGSTPFGIFQGIEFAWAQEKHPDLKPLLLSVYVKRDIAAVLVAKKDSNINSFADLKGKPVAIIKQGKRQVELFTAKMTGGKPEEFFSAVNHPANSEEGLDDVLLGKSQAAVVDEVGLQVYKEVNPGRYNRLKIVAKSEPFPPGAIGYHPGKVDASTVQRFRDGMLKANQSPKGREVMRDFKISRFEEVPADFTDSLAKIRKLYPAPK